MDEPPDERSESLSAGWDAAREPLKSTSRPGLIELVGELYAASHSNRTVVHDRLGLPPAGADAALLAESKAKLA